MFFWDVGAGPGDEAKERVVFVVGAADHWAAGVIVFATSAGVGEEGEFSGGELVLGFVKGDFGEGDGAGKGYGRFGAGEAYDCGDVIERVGAAARFDDVVGIGNCEGEARAGGAEGVANSAKGVGGVVALEVVGGNVDEFAIECAEIDRFDGAIRSGAEEKLFSRRAFGVGHVCLDASRRRYECAERDIYF